jgi:hypothetical protein
MIIFDDNSADNKQFQIKLALLTKKAYNWIEGVGWEYTLIHTLNEEWSVDSNGNVVLIKLEPINDELTKAVHTDTSQDESTTNQSNCCTTL